MTQIERLMIELGIASLVLTVLFGVLSIAAPFLT
jgi:hypothetical protein